jgi:hypothetical protein
MINLPNSIAKGEVLSFALNKTLVTAAVSDPYWSDSANISKCIVVYRSTSGRQRKRLEFDFTQESPTVAAEWSAKARNSFEIEEIVLMDFDGGSYVIPRSLLPSGKGISFGGEGGGGGGSIVTQVVHNYAPNGAVNDMVTDGSNVWIGGAFTSIRYMAPNVATISPTTAENQLKDIVTGKFPVFNGQINAFAFDGDDALFVGGAFTTMDSRPRNYFARLIRNGNDWESDADWNTGVTNAPGGTGVSVTVIVVLDDKILVGGSFATWNKGGSLFNAVAFAAISKSTKNLLYSGWNGTGSIHCNDIKVDGDHNWTCFSNGVIRKRLNSTGAFETLNLPTFGPTGYNCRSLAVTSDAVFVAGYFTTPKYYVAKLNKSDGSLISDFTPPWTTRLSSDQAYTVLIKDGAIFVGGTWNYQAIGKNITKLDIATGAVISDFNAGSACFRGTATGVVWKIIDSGSSIFALGQFDGKELSTSPATNGNAVKLNATTGAADTNFDTLSALQGSTELLRCGVMLGSNLLIGGLFSGWGGYARQGVAKLTKDADGNWKVVDAFNTASGGTTVNTLALSGDDLYIGGTFTTWAGSARNRVAKLNATTGALDPSFGVGVFTSGVTTGQFNGVTHTVRAIAIDGSDLVIGGAFTTYSKKSSATSNTTPSTPYWIRVNTTTNTELVPTSQGSNNGINTMAIDGDHIIFGGPFTWWAGNTDDKYIVRADKFTGAKVSSLVSATIGNTPIIYLLEIIDGKLFVGSRSSNVDGTGTAGTFVLNKENLSVIKSYLPAEFGGNVPHAPTDGGIIPSGDYVYFLLGRSDGAIGSAIKRCSRSTLDIDTNWGGSVSSGVTITSAAIVGNNVIISANGSGFSMLQPDGKRIYSLNLSDASQNSNI